MVTVGFEPPKFYTYTGFPKTLHYASYRNQPDDQKPFYGNIVYDKRVVRGHSWELRKLAKEALSTELKEERQKQKQRRVELREQLQQQLNSTREGQDGATNPNYGAVFLNQKTPQLPDIESSSKSAKSDSFRFNDLKVAKASSDLEVQSSNSVQLHRPLKHQKTYTKSAYNSNSPTKLRTRKFLSNSNKDLAKSDSLNQNNDFLPRVPQTKGSEAHSSKIPTSSERMAEKEIRDPGALHSLERIKKDLKYQSINSKAPKTPKTDRTVNDSVDAESQTEKALDEMSTRSEAGTQVGSDELITKASEATPATEDADMKIGNVVQYGKNTTKLGQKTRVARNRRVPPAKSTIRHHPPTTTKRRKLIRKKKRVTVRPGADQEEEDVSRKPKTDVQMNEDDVMYSLIDQEATQLLGQINGARKENARKGKGRQGEPSKKSQTFLRRKRKGTPRPRSGQHAVETSKIDKHSNIERTEEDLSAIPNEILELKRISHNSITGLMEKSAEHVESARGGSTKTHERPGSGDLEFDAVLRDINTDFYLWLYHRTSVRVQEALLSRFLRDSVLSELYESRKMARTQFRRRLNPSSAVNDELGVVKIGQLMDKPPKKAELNSEEYIHLSKMSEAELTRLGDRGYHAVIKANSVDIRVYQRDFADANNVNPTWKGALLTKEEWFDLIAAEPTISASLDAFAKEGQEPNLFVPLGHNGLHAVVNVFNNQILVQLRVYSRSFYDPDKLYPTKKGATLKPDEWAALCEAMKSISSNLAGIGSLLSGSASSSAHEAAVATSE